MAKKKSLVSDILSGKTTLDMIKKSNTLLSQLEELQKKAKKIEQEISSGTAPNLYKNFFKKEGTNDPNKSYQANILRAAGTDVGKAGSKALLASYAPLETQGMGGFMGKMFSDPADDPDPPKTEKLSLLQKIFNEIDEALFGLEEIAEGTDLGLTVNNLRNLGSTLLLFRDSVSDSFDKIKSVTGGQVLDAAYKGYKGITTFLLKTPFNIMGKSFKLMAKISWKAFSKGIEGLFNTFKSLGSSLISGFLGPLSIFNDLFESLGALLGTSLIPLITKLLTSMMENKGLQELIAGISQLVSSFDDSTSIMDYVTGFLDLVLQTLQAWIPELLTFIVNALPMLINIVLDAVLMVASLLEDNLPSIVEKILGMIPSIITKLTEVIPVLINTVTTLFPLLIEAIIKNIPPIIDAVISAVPPLLKAIITAIPLIVDAMLTLGPEIMKAVIGSVPDLISMLATEGIPLLLQGSVSLLKGMVGGIIVSVMEWIEGLGGIFEGIFGDLKDKVQVAADDFNNIDIEIEYEKGQSSSAKKPPELDVGLPPI